MPDDHRRPTPIEQVGQLAVSADEAAAAATELSEHVIRLTDELREERLWRRYAKRNGRILVAVMALFFAYIGWSNHQQTRLLGLLSTDGASCATSHTLGCENHQILVALPTLINSTDCRVRADLGLALHSVIPRAHFLFPPTRYCPAVAY